MLRRTALRRLIDDPNAWCRGILTQVKDELLLCDWKEPDFEPYSGCNEPWNPADGYVRRFQIKGRQNRLYGQFAMKFRTGPFLWQPAIIDTGARGIYLCRRTLTTLGVDMKKHAPLIISIGDRQFPSVLVTEEQDKSVDGTSLDGDVNILGMDFLGDGILPKVLDVVQERIGHPRPTSAVWVQQRDRSGQPVGSAFKVSPAVNDVDALKKAILPTATPLEQSRINIYAPGETTPADPDLALSETDAKKPFFFVLP